MKIAAPQPSEFATKVMRYLIGMDKEWFNVRLGVSANTVRNVVLFNHEPKASTKQIMEEYMAEHPPTNPPQEIR